MTADEDDPVAFQMFPLIKLAKKLKDGQRFKSGEKNLPARFPLIKLAKKLKERYRYLAYTFSHFKFPLIKLAKKLKDIMMANLPPNTMGFPLIKLAKKLKDGWKEPSPPSEACLSMKKRFH